MSTSDLASSPLKLADNLEDLEFAEQRVLVTGGEGFLGSHLTERLLAGNARVTVMDRVPESGLRNLAAVRERLTYVAADLCEQDPESVCEPGSFDVIFHLAGSATVPGSVAQPWEDFRANLLVTVRLLEALRRQGSGAKLVLFSSAAVYGDLHLEPIGDDAPTIPLSPYGVSKLAADRYAAVYAQLYGLRTASLRPFAVYGPRLRKQVVFDFMHKLETGQGTLHAHGDGTQVRDFCYVTDVVEAAMKVAARGALRGESYNVAAGQACSIHDLLQQLAEQMGLAADVHWSGKVRPGEPQRWIPDASRLRALGWCPALSLPEGLRRTVAWYRQEYVRETLASGSR